MSDGIILHERVHLQKQFTGDITDGLQADFVKRATEKASHLEESYFKKILKKDDAEITIQMKIEKDSHEKYIGKFHFNLDGDTFDYHNDKPFEVPFDVVSHAFKHLKEYLSAAK